MDAHVAGDAADVLEEDDVHVPVPPQVGEHLLQRRPVDGAAGGALVAEDADDREVVAGSVLPAPALLAVEAVAFGGLAVGGDSAVDDGSARHGQGEGGRECTAPREAK